MQKWIHVHKLEDMCINCAQNAMIILSENIIKYHNRKPVSLLNMFRHGISEDEQMLMYWLGKRFPEFYPEMEDLYNYYEYKRIREEAQYEDEFGEPFKKPDKSKCCEICQKKVKKLVDVYPEESELTGTLCIDCAQYVMRTMFEDIIEYHNGVRVSLAEIMYYGEQKIDQMIDEEKQTEEPIAKYRDSSKLFDFDNEYDESGNNNC